MSNKDLKEFPDLSNMYVRFLNISNNKIKKVNEDFLPKGIINLDVSHYNLYGSFTLKKSETIKNIDVSFNNLDTITVVPCIKNFNASNNDLIIIFFDCMTPNARTMETMDTLNISNNKRLSNVTRFSPQVFKSIIRENIKNDKDLIWSLEVSIID